MINCRNEVHICKGVTDNLSDPDDRVAECDDAVEAELFARRCAKEHKIEEAISWARRAIELECDACVMILLASLYLKKDDVEEAFNWSKQALACDQGQARALANLLLNKADVERHNEDKIPLYLHASEIGSPEADYRLGSLYA